MAGKFKFGLRGKVTLGLALMLLLSLAVTSLLSYLQSQQVAEQKVIELEQSKLEVLTHEIQGSLQKHQSILMSLRDVPPIQAILRARLHNGIDPESGDSLNKWKSRLQTIFSAFASNHTEYLQIRYIDSDGNEIVRVQTNTRGGVDIVSDALLQNKVGKVYVTETMKLLHDQVFFSKITLNREHGVIQIPHQPVLRMAIPVRVVDNQVSGMIVINLATDKLFSDIRLNNDGVSQFVVDEQGNYIKHSESEKTFAQDTGQHYNFKKEYPLLASFSENQDQLIRHFNNQQKIIGFQKIYYSPLDKKRYWLLALQVPESVVFKDIQMSLNKMLLVGLAIGLLSLMLVVWFVSRRILTPVLNLAAAAKRLQNGDLTVRLDTSLVHDEFRTLYETINTFTIKQQEYTNQLQQEIDIQTSRLSSVIENVVDGIITIDEKGKITTFNQAARKMFGYQDSEVIGYNVKMLMPDPYHSEHDGYLHNHMTTGIKKIIGIGREVIGRRKDGSEFPLDLAVSEVKMDNSIHFIGITRDVTERKRIELMQKEFISTVSHELRTPLTSISGSLGLILGGVTGELSDKTRALITIANNNSERLIHLINDILDIEKISAGKMHFDFAIVNLIPLIKKSLEENKGYSTKLDVRYKFVTGTEKEINVRVDEKRLLQVMSNILSNAAKYSPSGGQVDIKVETINDNARISVHDNGKGIPENFKPKIFNKFSQADSSDTRKKGGTGLGLNITQAIVLQLKGSIHFDSDEEQGTTFYVDLPLIDEKKITDFQIKKMDSNKPLILIIEDDHDVSKLLSIMLGNEGYQWDQAYDYDEAIQKIKINKYDAITLDLMIPGGSGISILRELRRYEKTMKLPVIVVSAVVNEGRLEVEGDAFEMVDWLEKPINSDKLIATIQSSLPARNNGVGRILHVEDDPDISAIVTSLLGDGFEVKNAATLLEAKKMVNNYTFDLVLLDVGLPDGSGLDLLPLLLDNEHQIPVVIFSAQDVPEEAASQVMATLIKSKTDNEFLKQQIKQAISRRIN
ncbi:MAG: PAS domain S-box-containing protein [Colwellia sp.]|jgi:PAS domain S-box-containing protein